MVGHMPRITSAIARTGTITATVRDTYYYSNDLLQDGFKDHLLHFFIYGSSLAEAYAMIMKSTLIQGKFSYIISL